MSNKPKDLRLGLLYLGRSEYSKVIQLLESKIPLYVENKEFYYILARAFFYTGDISGAKLYFDRGQKIEWDIDSALYLGVLGLKRRDFNSSLRIWLDILDEDPNNIRAKRGLAALKKYSTIDDLDNFIRSKKIDSFVPRKPYRFSVSGIIALSALVFILVLGVIVVKTDTVEKVYTAITTKFFVQSKNSDVVDSDRDSGSYFILSELNKNFIDFSSQSEYSFSGAQIEEFFKISNNLFLQHKDNRVRTYLNLIKNSNANQQVKQKAEALESYLVDPTWTNFSDSITFKDVYRDTFQYENCFVKWKGKLSNLNIVDKKLHFTLLVGYDSEKILEGIVQVELNENIKIYENQPIEVFGQVILRDNKFYIEAATVMQYIIKEK
ncbi:MAG: hypothetical protein B6229_04845 [Spirochaetaceae bacterium 4572_7]|nr:MAG: hypothetical protein B6229_04845 [Spirochaetaceae bacterium 4572_7]